MEQGKQGDLARRARINRLKRGILIFLFTAWILPVILCIILFVKMNRQEEVLDLLSDRVGVLLELKEQLLAVTRPDEVVEEAGEEVDEATLQSSPTSVVAEQVEAVEEAPVEEDYSDKKKIYLTFDDGPSSRTEDILDILKKYDAKATFFINGKEGEWAEELMKRIVEEGHTLGMHSYSHQYASIYKSEEAFLEDTSKIHDYILDVTGYDSKVYRFPGGSSNSISKISMKTFGALLADMGVVYFDWNISSQDATRNMLPAATIVENATKGSEKHDSCVILFHDSDSKASTVEALPLVIDKYLKEGDVVFLPITEATEPVQHVKSDLKTEEETED